ncbi:MAG: hypothetical protein EZS28_016216 [Streblomastix strix]|uniref:Uncharacterized protein n=1 Tax=Streblomastix strix TaxID=222440 RepID=A0A5J4W165_9EUKA|nr:MAG: hypothetical protein EZS28_016216 [Streblomastix strix]
MQVTEAIIALGTDQRFVFNFELPEMTYETTIRIIIHSKAAASMKKDDGDADQNEIIVTKQSLGELQEKKFCYDLQLEQMNHQ